MINITSIIKWIKERTRCCFGHDWVLHNEEEEDKDSPLARLAEEQWGTEIYTREYYCKRCGMVEIAKFDWYGTYTGVKNRIDTKDLELEEQLTHDLVVVRELALRRMQKEVQLVC